jgi:hypothetical protein
MCDASAAAGLDARTFVVANDEDNLLRVYRNDRPGEPIQAVDLSAFLRVKEKSPETDIEGAARVGRRIYWVTSHARNKDGERRPCRERFFAAEIVGDGDALRLVPYRHAYAHLLRDLLAEPALKPFGLSAASRKAPKEPDAFNIEGLSASPEGHLLLGFRNPVPGGLALLVPLLNPEGLTRGQPARFGPPLRLDLDGRGIREITWTGHDFLIVAGAFDGAGRSRLYRWAGPGSMPVRLRGVNLKGFNAEAAVTYVERGQETIQLLSDDGTKSVGGIPCKELSRPEERSFRSAWVQPRPAGGQNP